MKQIIPRLLLALVLVAVALAIWFFVTREVSRESPTPVPPLSFPSRPSEPVSEALNVPGTSVEEAPTQSQGSGIRPLIPSWLKIPFVYNGISTKAPAAAAQLNARAVETSEALADVISEFSSSIKPGAAVFASTYALQRWGDENSAGVALLEYVNGSWEVIDMGGGAPSIEWLVSLGVPHAAAQELLSKAGL